MASSSACFVLSCRLSITYVVRLSPPTTKSMPVHIRLQTHQTSGTNDQMLQPRRTNSFLATNSELIPNANREPISHWGNGMPRNQTMARLCKYLIGFVLRGRKEEKGTNFESINMRCLSISIEKSLPERSKVSSLIYGRSGAQQMLLVETFPLACARGKWNNFVWWFKALAFESGSFSAANSTTSFR